MRVLRLLFALLVVVVCAESAAAITCSSRPILYGTWRQVDGKRCWYHGRRVVSKTSLHWSSVRRERVKRTPKRERYASRRMIRVMPMPVETPVEVIDIWPPPPRLTPFEARWMGR